MIATLREVSVADATSAPSPSVDRTGWDSNDEELRESIYRNPTLEVPLAVSELVWTGMRATKCA